MYERDVYTLIKKDLPKITGKTILVDNNKGGEVLFYKVHSENYKEIKIFRFKITIGIFKFNHRIVVFLRPFKKNWDTSKNRLAPVYWGRKNHPLTNLWCIISNDFKNDILLDLNQIIVKDYILNKTLSRYLKNHTEKFTIDIFN
jgi:hypothetical protein